MNPSFPARNRPKAWVLTGLMLWGFLAVFLGLSASRAAHAMDMETPLKVDEILRRVQEATGPVPKRVAFQQDVRLTLAFFSWDFMTEVERIDGKVHVRTIGAPSLLPENLTGSLLDVTEALNDFELTSYTVERGPQGEPIYVLEGRRRPELTAGAEEGKIWVNGHTWQVEQVEARYPWGRVRVVQKYDRVEGHRVVVYQQAYLEPWRAELEVSYKNYRFDV